jgi:hypothetical protein
MRSNSNLNIYIYVRIHSLLISLPTLVYKVYDTIQLVRNDSSSYNVCPYSILLI